MCCFLSFPPVAIVVVFVLFDYVSTSPFVTALLTNSFQVHQLLKIALKMAVAVEVEAPQWTKFCEIDKTKPQFDDEYKKVSNFVLTLAIIDAGGFGGAGGC
jgi:hypothetical protein